MKKLDKFILTSFAGPFFVILLIVVFILMMQFLWVYIDELVGKGLGLRVILEFLFWGVCSQALSLALPLSTLLASMMTLGQMGENSELIAMKAAGVSLRRIMAPLMITCVLISLFAFYTLNNLAPYATNKIYTLRDDILKTKNEIKIPVGTFYDGIDNYIIRVGDRNRQTGMMYDMMVYDHSGRRGNTAVTVADSGMIRMSKDKDYLSIILYDGSNYQETNTKRYQDTTLALQRIEFTRQEMVIPLTHYAFEKSDSARFSEQPASMNLRQLRHGKDSLRQLSDRRLANQLAELPSATRLQFASQLDTSWKQRFSSNSPVDTLVQWENLDEQIRAYENTASRMQQFEATLRNFGIENFETRVLLLRTETAIWDKYAKALACLILFFIGAPLGALIRKGGLGSSAIVSALFFVLWWVIYISGTKLARNGNASALLGTNAANIVLLGVGIFLTRNAIKDGTLFHPDSTRTFWRKLKSQLMSFFRKPRIVYMGTPEFAVAPLEALLQAGYSIAGVVTVPDKPSGRGLKLNESAVKRFAVANGLPLLQPEKLKDPAFLADLAAWKADLFVVVGFRMLPEEVWKMPRLGTFNLHAALLPQYRGAAPINWAVIGGENLTGVTTFMIDKQIDTGGIIFREEHRIGPEDTAGQVHDALMTLGASLVVQTVEALLEGSVETRVQRSFIQGSERLKPAPKLSPELCHIDWDDSTRQVHNLIRGLSPYPAAFTELEGPDGERVKLKIFEARRIEGEAYRQLLAAVRPDTDPADVAPGTVLSDGKSLFAIATADGAVSILEMQLESKKRLGVKPFLAGFRDPMRWRALSGSSKAEIAKTRMP